MADGGDPKLNVDVDVKSGPLEKFFERASRFWKAFDKETNASSAKAVKGFKKIKASSGQAAEAFLESYIVYKATGSKIAASLQLVSFAIQEKLIGKLTLVAGLAVGAMRGLDAMGRRFKDVTIGAAADIEELTTQFTPLLGSITAAKDRIKELQAFAIGTPFNLDDLILASKSLETLTRGALTTEKGMTMVGDAAAVAGTDFESMARIIGRAYSLLEAGRPLGFTALRLQELGILSGTTRNKLESLLESGAKGTRVWKVLADELERTSGAMKAMENNLNTLEANFEDAVAKLKGGFGSAFFDGEKAVTKAGTDAIEKLTPELEKVGRDLAVIPNLVDQAKAKFVDLGSSVLSTKGLISGLALAINSLMAFILGGTLAKGITGLDDLVTGATKTGPALTGLKKAAQTVLPPLKKLGSFLKNVLTESFKGLATTWGILGGSLAVGVGVWLHVLTRMKETAAAIEEMGKATQKGIDKLEDLRKEVRTGADAARVYKEQINLLSGAYRRLQEAEDSGNKKRIRTAKSLLTSVKAVLDTQKSFDVTNFQRTGADLDFEIGQQLAEEERQRRKLAQDRNFMGKEERIKSLEEEIKKSKDLIAVNEEQIRSDQLVQPRINQEADRNAVIEERIKLLKEEIRLEKNKDTKAGRIMFNPLTGGTFKPFEGDFMKLTEAEVAKREKEIESLQKKLVKLTVDDSKLGKLRAELAEVTAQIKQTNDPREEETLRGRRARLLELITKENRLLKDNLTKHQSIVAENERQLRAIRDKTAAEKEALAISQMKLRVQQKITEAQARGALGDEEGAASALKGLGALSREAEIRERQKQIEDQFPTATEKQRREKQAALDAVPGDVNTRRSLLRSEFSKQLKEGLALGASLSGDERGSERFLEQAAVLQDRIDKQSLISQLQNADVGAEEAQAAGNSLMALRAIERERGRANQGVVTASDLTRIGGASRVRGVDANFDPNLKELKTHTDRLTQMEKYLSEIAKSRTNGDIPVQ